MLTHGNRIGMANAGYKIVANAEMKTADVDGYRGGICMAENARGHRVTWEYNADHVDDYFHGHYYESPTIAQEDYIQRAVALMNYAKKWEVM